MSTVERDGLVIAIDGPSGSGKSTVARGVASALGLRYLDTGAMYRAVTWLALDRGVDLAANGALAELAAAARIEVLADPAAPSITIEDEDVTLAVRGPAVTASVSTVSAVSGVREAMVTRQRALIGRGGIVVEGRDIGTTVAPDASVKIYLVADPAARAERRARQDALAGHGAGLSGSATEADLLRRDTADSSRASSPLTQAADAVVIDSTALDAEQVIERVVQLAEAVGAR